MHGSRYLLKASLGVCLWLAMAPAVAEERAWQQPGTIQTPKEIQVPGEIQQPTGPWLVPGAIQAVERPDRPCELQYVANSDALFEFASATLNAAGEDALSAVLAQIQRRVPPSIRVRGHTDSIGSESANLALSERRAEAVGDWLIKRLGQHTELRIEAIGEAEPVAPNQTPAGDDDPQGRARNRRVEIILQLPGC